MDAQDLSSAEARLLVLEMSVAALIAQLPQQSLEEVASMLCFVADTTEDAEEFTTASGNRQLGYVRHWASEMLHRVMVSRKGSRADAADPVLSGHG
jgi:hypothetical protein